MSATEQLTAWLSSPIGQSALADVKERYPNVSASYSGRIGYCIGLHAAHISDSAVGHADIDAVSRSIFGETDKERTSREQSAAGGKSTSEAKRAASAANGAKGGRPKKQP